MRSTLAAVGKDAVGRVLPNGTSNQRLDTPTGRAASPLGNELSNPSVCRFDSCSGHQQKSEE
ncbi:hypothetical protein Pla100_51110 [Neorhodopirellula pilleata]|uniref:Uncharacterized protein n=1 Tax=Neorhodopirellula pilleata TaxID=2714738 RepID=A0A5C5ZVT3_9BACT|nr:hypothetical protein Pla100_51110 [Neorhodopirellula pilleata]